MSNDTTSNRKVRNTIVGKVIKCSAAKTVAVEVSEKVKEPHFKKYETKVRKIHAHDEKNECKVGDVVRVMETRPLSKIKRHRVLEIVKH